MTSGCRLSRGPYIPLPPVPHEGASRLPFTRPMLDSLSGSLRSAGGLVQMALKPGSRFAIAGYEFSVSTVRHPRWAIHHHSERLWTRDKTV